MKSIVVTLCLLLTVTGQWVFAQAPELINYQAKLDVGGELVTASGVEVVFRLFDDETIGTMLYAETQTVDVVNGFYATDIGASNAVSGALFTALENPSVWLEVQVDGSTLTPRERLVTVPYAAQAGSVVGGVADGDASSNNELNTSVTLNGPTLEIVDAGGTKSTSLAGLLDNTDAQALSFNGGNNMLSITGGNTVDLSSLAGGGGGSTGAAIIKPSDQTVATTTLGNDSHLTFSNMQPGTYLLTGALKFFGASNDARVGLAFTGAGSVSYTVDTSGMTQAFNASSPEIAVASIEPVRELHGVLVVTSAGTLTLQFARFDNNDGDGCTLRAGSFLAFDKIN